MEKKKMTDKDKLMLKKLPRTRCSECGSRQSYTNPMARCWGCNKKFCFDHIESGRKYSDMKNWQEFVDMCSECANIHDPAYKKDG